VGCFCHASEYLRAFCGEKGHRDALRKKAFIGRKVTKRRKKPGKPSNTFADKAKPTIHQYAIGAGNKRGRARRA